MNVREWALISFTILAQMSVGAFVVLGIVHFFAQRKAGAEEADRLSDRALLAIGPVMVLGLLVSLLHLGNPLNAYRAVGNIGSSWLSREIFFGVLFAVLGGAFAIAQWRKMGSFAVRNVLAWAAALVGLALVYSMASVYQISTVPAWNLWATPISFFATTLLLGVLAMGAAFVANYAYIQRKNPDCADQQCTLMREALRWIAVAAVVLLGIELLVVPLQVAYLAAAGGTAAKSAALMYGQFGLILALRLVLLFTGAGVLGVFLYQYAQSPGREKMLGYLAYGAFALVLVSEGLGRFIFYATHLRIGI